MLKYVLKKPIEILLSIIAILIIGGGGLLGLICCFAWDYSNGMKRLRSYRNKVQTEEDLFVRMLIFSDCFIDKDYDA